MKLSLVDIPSVIAKVIGLAAVLIIVLSVAQYFAFRDYECVEWQVRVIGKTLGRQCTQWEPRYHKDLGKP